MIEVKLWSTEKNSLTQLKFPTYSMNIGVTVCRKKRQPSGEDSTNILTKESKENNKSLPECEMK